MIKRSFLLKIVLVGFLCVSWSFDSLQAQSTTDTGSLDPTQTTPQVEEAVPPEAIAQHKVLYICPSHDDGTGEPSLCLVNADGSGAQRIAHGGTFSRPRWSWDGEVIYIAQNQGPAHVTVDGLPPIEVPSNMDIVALDWMNGAFYYITETPESEWPLQNFPKDDETLLIEKSLFVVKDSALKDGKTKAEIRLEMITLPHVLSLASGESTLPGNAEESMRTVCTAVPLSKPMGLSPQGHYAAVEAMLCDAADDSQPTRPGFMIMDVETEEFTTVEQNALKPCATIIDLFGGPAINDDGTLFQLPFDTEQYRAFDCRYYLSPDRKYVAFIDEERAISLMPVDASQEPVKVPFEVPPVSDRISWAPDGKSLLSFASQGGPLTLLSLDNPQGVYIGQGSDPSWSLVLLEDVSAPAVDLGVPSLRSSNLSAATQSGAAGGCTLMRH